MRTRKVNKILSTEMDVLRRSARKSRMERIKNEHTKEIMGVKEKPDIMDGASAVSGLQDGRQRNSHSNQPYFSDISPRSKGS